MPTQKSSKSSLRKTTKILKPNTKFKPGERWGQWRGLVFIVVFSIIGCSLLLFTHAEDYHIACPTDKGAPIMSEWGWRESTQTYHAGIDIDVRQRPIYAAESGRIIYSGDGTDDLHWGYQQTIDLQGVSGRVYRYAHLQSRSVSAGQGVVAGQNMGVTGNGDGELTAWHLHWEIRTDGGRDGKINGSVNPIDSYRSACDPNSSNPPAGANTSTSINNPGTACHTYTLQYDPSHYYPCVLHLQNDIGIAADGYFGPATKSAVQTIQAQHGLNQSGIVDPPTWCVIHTDLPGCSTPVTAPAPVTPPPVTSTPTSQAVQGRIWRDDNANGQQDNGEPLIGNAGSCGYYVNVDASVAAAGQLVNADRCMSGPFYFIPTSAGTVTVSANPPQGWSSTNGNSRTVNVSPGQNVDVQWFGMRPAQAAPAPTVYTAPPTTTTAPSTGGQIVGVASNRCIDVPGQNFSNGQFTQLWDCNGSRAQQWTFQSNGTIQAANNKCLDIAGYNTANGAAVEIYDCHGGSNQQWTRNPDGTIRSRLNGKCLDATGYGTSNGTRLQMYDCVGGSNQKWR